MRWLTRKGLTANELCNTVFSVRVSYHGKMNTLRLENRDYHQYKTNLFCTLRRLFMSWVRHFSLPSNVLMTMTYNIQKWKLGKCKDKMTITTAQQCWCKQVECSFFVRTAKCLHENSGMMSYILLGFSKFNRLKRWNIIIPLPLPLLHNQIYAFLGTMLPFLWLSNL